MMGACAGGGSGAGIRLSNAGICGAGAPRIVGSCTKPPRPDPWPAPGAKPPRASPGVDPTIQATANTAAKKRCMIVFPCSACSSWVRSSRPDRKRLYLYCPDWNGLAVFRQKDVGARHPSVQGIEGCDETCGGSARQPERKYPHGRSERRPRAALRRTNRAGSTVSSALLGPWCQISRRPGHAASTKDFGCSSRRSRASPSSCIARTS